MTRSIARAICLFAIGMVATATLTANPARAELSISSKPTRNVSCSGGNCAATAHNAVMNVSDLESLLAAQSSVSLGASVAKTISVDAALNWVNTSTLTLKAKGPISVNSPVTVVGKGGVTVQSGGMVFARKASLTFWDLGSALTINGSAYQLVADVTGLQQAIAQNHSGFFAFAKDHDASAEKDLSSIYQLHGTFNGLGHTISNVVVAYPDGSYCGLFGENYGTISNIAVRNLEQPRGCGQAFGYLVGHNMGLIDHARASGKPNLMGIFIVGGLVGINEYGGRIINSSTHGTVGGGNVEGGLAGLNGGMIDQSYTTATIFNPKSETAGLVGETHGGGWHRASVSNSYAIANLKASAYGQVFGGLIGILGPQVAVSNSYSATNIANHKPYGIYNGGVVGYVSEHNHQTPLFTNTYWDTNTGVKDPAQGAGNVANQSGITGLKDSQLKSGLPAGFDPKIWAIDPNINDGYPYLIANPPQ